MFLVGCIALYSAMKFWDPIISVRFRKPCSPAAIVLMPKAPVNKDHFAKCWEHEIGFSWKIPAMKTIAVAHTVGETTDRHLWPGIFALYCTHDSATIFGNSGHYRISILRLGSVSTFSTISLYLSISISMATRRRSA